MRCLGFFREKKKRQFYEQNIGKSAQVLFEEGNDNYSVGFTANYVKVAVEKDAKLTNNFLEVSLEKMLENGMMGVKLQHLENAQ